VRGSSRWAAAAGPAEEHRVAASRHHSVDEIDVALFDMYARPPEAVADLEAGADRSELFDRMYYADMTNLIRDLIWIRDGPMLPDTTAAEKVALYVAWLGVSKVQDKYRFVEPSTEVKTFIDVATFHYVVSEPIWSEMFREFPTMANMEKWHVMAAGADISLELNGEGGRSPLPSPRDLLSELRAIRRHGTLNGAPIARGQDEKVEWVVRQPTTSLETAQVAAVRLRSMKLFAAGSAEDLPTREGLAQLLMFVIGIAYGEFAIEFERALLLADAIHAVVKDEAAWNGGICWMVGALDCFSNLLQAWDEVVAMTSVQSLNPVKRLGCIPNPVSVLDDVIARAEAVEEVDAWVFLDSEPAGARVPLHMLAPGSSWKLHNHDDENGLGVLYEWPARDAHTYRPVQRCATFRNKPSVGPTATEAPSPSASTSPRPSSTSPSSRQRQPVVSPSKGEGAAAAAPAPGTRSDPISVCGDEDSIILMIDRTVKEPDGWALINDFVSKRKYQVVECGINGACFFNSVVYLLGLGNSRHRDTVDRARRGPSYKLRCAVIKRMKETMPEMKERYGKYVPYYRDGKWTWEEYLDYIKDPVAWVYGSWEINATSDVIGRAIRCVQFEDWRLMSCQVGTPMVAKGPPIIVARHSDHYRAVERLAHLPQRPEWML